MQRGSTIAGSSPLTMRVATIIQAYHPRIGGAEKLVGTVSPELQKLGVEVRTGAATLMIGGKPGAAREAVDIHEALDVTLASLSIRTPTITGYLDSGERARLTADAFVLPSQKEGLPYVLLEAGFAYVPVVATDVAARGVREEVATVDPDVREPASRLRRVSLAHPRADVERVPDRHRATVQVGEVADNHGRSSSQEGSILSTATRPPLTARRSGG